MPEIRIGTSGFSFSDWRKGVIYPKGLKQSEELKYYAQELKFDTLEVNATYYAVMAQKNAAAMEAKTDSGFEFVVKGYRGFTHDPFDTRRKEGKLPLADAYETLKRFRESVEPFHSAGKLGAVLLQFPVFFYPSADSWRHIDYCISGLEGIEAVIEFRNSAWITEETFKKLEQMKVSYCAVDEPDLPRLVKFQPRVTGPVGYLRFHGRNKEWFNAPLEVRYDYLYTKEELQPFVSEINNMAKQCDKMYVFFNNCHAGSAVKNAMDLKGLNSSYIGGKVHEK